MSQRSMFRHTLVRPAACAACWLPVVCAGSARADLVEYVNATGQNPTRAFLATNPAFPAEVNIGALAGANTYEFIVNATGNTSGSLALLGWISDGYDGEAIKFEQFPYSGVYGATIFGFADYLYSEPSRYGAPVVLAFVADPAAQTTRLFVDGVDTGSTVPFAVSLSGVVALGSAWNPGQGYFDLFEGTIIAAATYDSMLSPDEIAAHAEAYYDCYADSDDNGVLDLFDFLAFVNLFNAADPTADCDANATLDLFDFLCFTNAFNAGC